MKDIVLFRDIWTSRGPFPAAQTSQDSTSRLRRHCKIGAPYLRHRHGHGRPRLSSWRPQPSSSGAGRKNVVCRKNRQLAMTRRQWHRTLEDEETQGRRRGTRHIRCDELIFRANRGKEQPGMCIMWWGTTDDHFFPRLMLPTSHAHTPTCYCHCPSATPIITSTASTSTLYAAMEFSTSSVMRCHR